MTFAAVGAPRSFQMLLMQHHIKPVRNFEFTDHHRYSPNDLSEIQRVSETSAIEDVITTEKDYYRDPKLISETLNPLVLATRFRITSGEEALLERLFRLFK